MDPDQLAAQLGRQTPSPPPPGQRLAAVAALLRFEPDPRVLLMRRPQRQGDPWSGQVALPGGHVEEQDASLQAAAERETMEEVGLQLDAMARPLGPLPLLQARARRKRLSLYVAPFVFHELEAAEPTPSDEAEHIFWFPLEAAWRGELGGRFGYTGDDVTGTMWFPSWNFADQVVWGMTYRILETLLEALYGSSRLGE